MANAVKSERVHKTQVETKSAAETHLADVLEKYMFLTSCLLSRHRNSVYFTPYFLKESAVSPHRKMCRLSQFEKKEVQRQVEGLLKKWYVQPACSPHGGPVTFLHSWQYPMGFLCSCIDFKG